MKYIVSENVFSGSRFGAVPETDCLRRRVSAKCAEENREGVCQSWYFPPEHLF
jgi:hypothetical protein